MSKDRDEIQVRLDNDQCPKCLVELKGNKNEEVRKCWACGLVISTQKDKDE
tara:strand:- start:2369 stop:2521 length:153 start_codon:yes stop_codon:yes gene_type:complete